uniref:Uncharacterized protein n=1 Tax=Anguilla anguilla TaxID=7936 RepID=A0A0E9VFU7_ANGAN
MFGQAPPTFTASTYPLKTYLSYGCSVLLGVSVYLLFEFLFLSFSV